MERIGAAVIGGGAVGCAVAHELARTGIRNVFVLERMPSAGEVQSGRNSGVVHAGIYYATGSHKAELCVEANALMYEFCHAHGVPIANVGKLIVAASPDEVPALEAIHAQSAANGVPGVRLLTRAAVRQLEPNIDVPAALHVPTTGIVDAASYTRTLARLAEAQGASVLTSFEVTRIVPDRGGVAITGRRGGHEETFLAEIVVNAAGLNCDVIGRMIDPDLEVEVVPLRGEYFKINRRRRPELWLAGLNIYPVPEWLDLDGERAKMVGVHLTPTFSLTREGEVVVGDTVTVGPEFVRALARDDYETGRKPASLFYQRAHRFFPALALADLAIDFAGIMVHVAGQTDFIIARDQRHANCIQLIGIDSPGLTCSLAIARRVRTLLQ
ncbi:MAG: FAD-dependent oxidoreductase [Acidobacteriota bacterium]